MKNKDIIGIHYGHDATVTLIRDGTVLESMSEERLARIKKYQGFPHLAYKYVMEKYNIDDPKIFIVGRLAENRVNVTLEENINARKNAQHRSYFLRASLYQIPFLHKIIAYRDRLKYKKTLARNKKENDAFFKEMFPNKNLVFIDHHLSHAYASLPFIKDHSKPYLIFTLDGAGDDLSGTISHYENGHINVLHKTSMHDSLGLIYSSIVDILGMKRNEHEFKVMGLAPYAKESAGLKVYEELRQIIRFDKKSMTFVSKIDAVEAVPHLLAKEFYRFRFDSIAYGVQLLTEELIKDMISAAVDKYKVRNIVVAGGVFMNVKANQKVLEMPEVDTLVITPSCGDESLSIGAAVYGYLNDQNSNWKNIPFIDNLYLGSEYYDSEIKEVLDSELKGKDVKIEYFDPKKGESIEEKVAELLAQNSVVGRFKGRAEWGARALGNRSILANPSSRDNVKLINEMIKNRDFWMPFATSILYERRNDYLENPKDFYAPYMHITFNTKEAAHKDLIAALHPYDLTSRPQMVKRSDNPEYYDLIKHFESLTGIGGVLNTSFNLHGEPNVEKPEDAVKTFLNSSLPHLAIGNFLCSKLSE